MFFQLYRKSKYTLYAVLNISTLVDACISIFSFEIHKPICTHSLPLSINFFQNKNLFFVSSEAPNFFLFGDLKTNALVLFIVGGILILLWIVSGVIGRKKL